MKIKVALFVVGLAISIAVLHSWLLWKSYVFNADDVAAVAEHALGQGLRGRDTFKVIEERLRKQYPGHILVPEHTEWLFVNCGGWMGAMKVLHASVTEYVMLFGTAVPTSGHSGRYWANISDTLLSGTFQQWHEGTTESHNYSVGDTIAHTWGDVTMISWTSDTWMLEYGRGLIPSTLPFALADTVFSTTDFVNLAKILRVYSIALWLELRTSISNLLRM